MDRQKRYYILYLIVLTMARMCNCASKLLEVSSLEGLDYPEWVLPLSGITLQFYRTVHWAAMKEFFFTSPLGGFRPKSWPGSGKGAVPLDGIWRSD